MSCIKCNSHVKLRKSFQDQKIYIAYTRSSYLKGARVRNCAEKDVVITVDKCRKEKRNRNSRRLMTPSISFYTSCDVTKHQPSFPFWTLDVYSRVKSVHLERLPFPHSHPLQPRVSSTSIVRDRVASMSRVRMREDNRYQTSVSDVESKRVPKGRKANGPPGSRALLLLWLMTCDPPPSPSSLEHLPPIYHWELAKKETVASN